MDHLSAAAKGFFSSPELLSMMLEDSRLEVTDVIHFSMISQDIYTLLTSKKHPWVHILRRIMDREGVAPNSIPIDAETSPHEVIEHATRLSRLVSLFPWKLREDDDKNHYGGGYEQMPGHPFVLDTSESFQLLPPLSPSVPMRNRQRDNINAAYLCPGGRFVVAVLRHTIRGEETFRLGCWDIHALPGDNNSVAQLEPVAACELPFAEVKRIQAIRSDDRSRMRLRLDCDIEPPLVVLVDLVWKDKCDTPVFEVLDFHERIPPASMPGMNHKIGLDLSEDGWVHGWNWNGVKSDAARYNYAGPKENYPMTLLPNQLCVLDPERQHADVYPLRYDNQGLFTGFGGHPSVSNVLWTTQDCNPLEDCHEQTIEYPSPYRRLDAGEPITLFWKRVVVDPNPFYGTGDKIEGSDLEHHVTSVCLRVQRTGQVVRRREEINHPSNYEDTHVVVATHHPARVYAPHHDRPDHQPNHRREYLVAVCAYWSETKGTALRLEGRNIHETSDDGPLTIAFAEIEGEWEYCNTFCPVSGRVLLRGKSRGRDVFKIATVP